MGSRVQKLVRLVFAATLAASAAPGGAHASSNADPAAPHALGRVLTAGPGAQAITLLSSGGYGYTEAVLGNGDSHHRVAGMLGAEGRPLPWLGLALRLDGRYDAHVVPGLPTDRGLVGDPRIFARVDRTLTGGLRLGARAGVWLPGNQAPSLTTAAISPELVGMLSYVAPGNELALSANAGYRLDRSAASAPQAAELGPGDRLALSVSSFDAILLGAAASYGRGRAQGFVEASWELLVGSGHPSAASSPLRAATGARLAFGERLGVEAAIEVSPSTRPDVGAVAALVPVPPRVAGWLGVSVRFDGGRARTEVATRIAATPERAEPAAVSAEVVLRGRVTAADGGELAELRVTVAAADGERALALDPERRFTVEGKPGDEVTLAAEATGYAPARVTARFDAGAADPVVIRLERTAPRGQLRGLVRALKGGTVAAEVRVERDDGGAAASPNEASGAPAGEAAMAVRAENGRFEMDVAPGRYVLTISAPGYETQKRRVEVEPNGVTLLNVDLRSAR